MEPTLLELGKWGSQYVPSSPEDATLLHANSYALTLKTFFRPERARGLDETYELHIDDEVLHVRIAEGRLLVQQSNALKADAIFRTDMPAYLKLLSGGLAPDEAIKQGLIRIVGDPETLHRFLKMCGLPVAGETS